MVTAADEKLKGRVVCFLVRDVHIPEPTTILHQLHDNDELWGEVVDFSDNAHAGERPFAVVKVPELHRVCIVSVDRLRHVRQGAVTP